MKYIDGGVCTPKGFEAAGINAGFKKGDKKDFSLILSEKMCSVAGVYTTNKVKGAPIAVTKKNILDGKARAIICNSGNANTCASNGIEIAEQTCMLLVEELNSRNKVSEDEKMIAEDVVVASTGVIGQELDIETFKNGIPNLVKALSVNGGSDAAKAIMTTDTISKEIAVEFMIGERTCRIAGIAKGSGMINPNMATMLSFVTSDVAISSEMLNKAVKEDVGYSYNQISVDGDTSTNDMFMVLANGAAQNEEITEECKEYDEFKKALAMVTIWLSKKLARDGEGATKLIACNIIGAPNLKLARTIGKSVISSNLLKAAMFGEDANWGRVLCALGYVEGDFDGRRIDVDMSSKYGSIRVCENSMHKEYDEEEASKILSEEEINININMNQGTAKASAWGCDLTYDYVRINGDYRS